MKILHSSDLHGEWYSLTSQDLDFDLWIDSGDFFPNETRGFEALEIHYQEGYLGRFGASLVKWLGNRPMISVGGNHDYVSLARYLQSKGSNAHDLTEKPFHFKGETFAGFREIPYIIGEWKGETYPQDFEPIINKAFDANPTILVTHAPPNQILDFAGDNYGIPVLTSALSWRKHRIRHHFFGHIHTQGGKDDVQMGISFHNSATFARIIEIS